MRKIIKKYGDSAVIVLSTEDLITHQLKVGSIIELAISKIKDGKYVKEK